MTSSTIPLPTSGKLALEKFSEGHITCVRMSGAIDEQFDGKKLAASIKADKLVIDLGGIVRISSFGVREWLAFIAGANAKAIYLINCPPKVINQLNMVANFSGPNGHVFSFQAPYHCDYCDEDHLVLLNVDRDHEAIKKLRAPDHACEACGNPEEFDEEPISYFSALAAQKDFELDPAVGNFLITKLDYPVASLARRVQANKFIEGRNTYVKLSGNLDGSFPAEKLGEGMEGTIVLDVGGIAGIDPKGAAEFRKMISMMRPNAERIILVDCEPNFLERTLQADDFAQQLAVASFAVPYSCTSCKTNTSHTVDVAAHHDVIRIASVPPIKCPECRAEAVGAPSDATLAMMPSLPPPNIAGELAKFIKKGQKQKFTAVQQKDEVGMPSWLRTALPVAAVVMLGLFGFLYYQQQRADERVEEVATKVTDAKKNRPAWITSATPFSAYCTDLSNRLVCVGVSSYLKSQASARSEASNAALEALATTVGLRIDNPMFREHVRPIHADTRQIALADLEEARGDQSSADFGRAVRVVREGHRAVAQALRRTGGDAVPAQIADWYWEEFKALDGEGTEFLGFVRYDVPMTAVKSLTDTYALESDVLGAKALTTFPAVGWRYPDATSGAMIVEVEDGPLKTLGAQTGDIVLAIRDKPVRDAEDFASRIAKEHGAGRAKLAVKSGERAPIQYDGPWKEPGLRRAN